MALKSWTRTLNLDDAHTLLALCDVGVSLENWSRGCHSALQDTISQGRRRELIRILRDGFLSWQDGVLQDGLFFRHYRRATAVGQIQLVAHHWALTHPITAIAVARLVQPRLDSTARDIPLSEIEGLVSEHVDTKSRESLRKTRTVLLGALEGIGAIRARGTGPYRTLEATRGRPDVHAFAYLIDRDQAPVLRDGLASSLAVTLTGCDLDHAAAMLDAGITRGFLAVRDRHVVAL